MRRLQDLGVNQLAGVPLAPGNLPAALMLSATEPAARSAGARTSDTRLIDAMKHEMGRQRKVVDGTGVDQAMPEVSIDQFTPGDKLEAIQDVLLGDSSKYAGNKRQNVLFDDGVREVENITINPNADEAFLFHELGHIANRQSGFGKTVRDLRNDLNSTNPALKNSLMAAALLAPGTATALIPGDDDAGAALALGAAAYAPVLADEVMASNTGLRMMETAGTRASLGQRGKLAGALMSYLAAPITIAALSGATGNNFD